MDLEWGASGRAEEAIHVEFAAAAAVVAAAEVVVAAAAAAAAVGSVAVVALQKTREEIYASLQGVAVVLWEEDHRGDAWFEYSERHQGTIGLQN